MQIKFITLNLLHGGEFFPQIVEFLHKEDPDIIAFQEVYDSKDHQLPRNFQTIEELKKTLPLFDYHFAPELNMVKPENKIPFGNAIFSKIPIIDSHVVFFEIPFGDVMDGDKNFAEQPKNIHTTKLQLHDTELNIFNTHGIWGLDGADTEDRLKMSKTIVNEIKGKKNVILAGDFNIKPNTQTILDIEKHLKNVFKDELTSTFNMRHKTNPGYATAVVDMIFVSPEIQVIEHYCPDVDVSDHMPLVMTVEV